MKVVKGKGKSEEREERKSEERIKIKRRFTLVQDGEKRQFFPGEVYVVSNDLVRKTGKQLPGFITSGVSRREAITVSPDVAAILKENKVTG